MDWVRMYVHDIVYLSVSHSDWVGMICTWRFTMKHNLAAPLIKINKSPLLTQLLHHFSSFPVATTSPIADDGGPVTNSACMYTHV